ncbi:hypothetical protein ABZZ74_43535 [Streptomyces sp. NPDC006476]|uniref:hypothetical protein n=1 Tax=Streptomyces sp. NPDC006476 TaxID=3157175 RepID=UPI0033B90C72
MASPQPVVIYPPAEDGGRRIRVDEHFVGLAYGMLDIVEREPSPSPRDVLTWDRVPPPPFMILVWPA